MSERTIEQALAHAEQLRPIDVEGTYYIADLVLLAAEVLRLRAETHQLRMIAIDITPYLHLTICRECKQQKMCVEGNRSDGKKPAQFFECEDCSQEIKRKIEARVKGIINE